MKGSQKEMEATSDPVLPCLILTKKTIVVLYPIPIMPQNVLLFFKMNHMTQFTLEAPYEYIQLNQLLKLINLAETGGEANLCITEGRVKVNGVTVLQKLRPGDKIEFEGQSMLMAP